MKTLAIIFLVAIGFVACNSPKPTTTTTQDTVRTTNPDTAKMRQDTIPRP